ncbi:cytochrome P450 [Fomes fomentarius]|nr:cytochrome P450 [Fomes fomentarius]
MDSVLSILAIASVLFLCWWRVNHRLPLPPSPGLASLTKEPWKVYAQWSSQLGPLITSTVGGRPIIVINTLQAAIELVEKRSHFACRPRFAMAELLGRDKNVGFQYYGERLKRSRKALHGSLNQTAITQTWGAFLDFETTYLLRRLYGSPDSLYDSLQEGIVELVLRFSYGKTPEAEYLDLAKEVMNQTGIAIQPGKWAVNSVPILRHVPSWFPGAAFKRWARAARQDFERLKEHPFLQVKAEMARGVAPPSFVRNALESNRGSPEDEDIIMSAAGSLYGAGTDTISAVILTAFLLLSQYPDVQRKVHDEILSVVGCERLPELGDRDALPYLDCVIQEVLRFNPPIALVPHSNWKEDEYGGYRIPRRTSLMVNLWAMLHDANEYSDPENFYPERFMVSNGKLTPRDPRSVVYGFGRRSCPGTHFANHIIFLTLSRAIASFKILPTRKDGDQSLSPIEFMPAFIQMPVPFQFTLSLRDTKAATELIDPERTSIAMVT